MTAAVVASKAAACAVALPAAVCRAGRLLVLRTGRRRSAGRDPAGRTGTPPTGGARLEPDRRAGSTQPCRPVRGAQARGSCCPGCSTCRRPRAATRVRHARELGPRTTLTGEQLPPLLATAAAARAEGALTGRHVEVIISAMGRLRAAQATGRAAGRRRSIPGRAGHTLRCRTLRGIARRLLDTLDPDGTPGQRTGPATAAVPQLRSHRRRHAPADRRPRLRDRGAGHDGAALTGRPETAEPPASATTAPPGSGCTMPSAACSSSPCGPASCPYPAACRRRC